MSAPSTSGLSVELLLRVIDVKYSYFASRASVHKLLEISQNVFRNFSKRCSKKTQIFRSFLSSFIWSDAKLCNLCNKSNISEHFCAILRCTGQQRR